MSILVWRGLDIYYLKQLLDLVTMQNAMNDGFYQAKICTNIKESSQLTDVVSNFKTQEKYRIPCTSVNREKQLNVSVTDTITKLQHERRLVCQVGKK